MPSGCPRFHVRSRCRRRHRDRALRLPHPPRRPARTRGFRGRRSSRWERCTTHAAHTSMRSKPTGRSPKLTVRTRSIGSAGLSTDRETMRVRGLHGKGLSSSPERIRGWRICNALRQLPPSPDSGVRRLARRAGGGVPAGGQARDADVRCLPTPRSASLRRTRMSIEPPDEQDALLVERCCGSSGRWTDVTRLRAVAAP